MCVENFDWGNILNVLLKILFYKKRKIFIGNGVLLKEEFVVYIGFDFIFKDFVFNNFDLNYDGVLLKDEFVEKFFVVMN